METKFCTRCKRTKDVEEFYKSVSICKICHGERQKEYKKTERYRKWYEGKQEELLEKARIKSKIYYHSLPTELKKESNKRNYAKHRSNHEAVERKRAYSKEYEERNKDKRRIQRAITRKRRYWSDINYRLEILLRTRFYKAVKRYKVKSASNLVGCSSEELRVHIESKWKPEMNWGNFGKIWEIDHIIPINSFDLSLVSEQEKCFHYTNLQPLFKTTEIANSFGYNEIGNMNKRNKIFS